MKPAIKASVTACVICGAPLPAWRPLDGVLCRASSCAAAHRALATAGRCAQCTRPLTPVQRARGHCDNRACRDEVQRERRAAAEARAAALQVRLEARRARAAARRGMSHEDVATYPVALLPRNDDRVSRLPRTRRAAHEAHLRESLADARRSLAASRRPPVAPTAVSMPATTPERQAEAELLLAGCAACRGRCCRQGGDHAFISEVEMLALLQRLPGADDDTIIAHYLQHLGTHTMTHGCVYQGALGCTLSADLRADICHRFLCTGLLMLQGKFNDGQPVRAYLIHRRGEALSGDRFVEIPVREADTP